ncbi:MAG: site-2 protease family protein [Pseudomonadota bacterium]
MKIFTFRLLGFPVGVHPMVWLLLAFVVLSFASDGPMGLAMGLLWAGVAFTSVLVHELGHALAAKAFGLGPVEILLHGFGGLTRFRRAGSTTKSLLVTAAGPGAGLALAALSAVGSLGLALLPLLPGAGFLLVLLGTSLRVNLFWSLFNLLPMAPLDGGQILGHLLILAGMRPQRTQRAVAYVSLGLAAAIALGAILLHQWFLILVAFLAVQRNLPVLTGRPVL